MEPKRLFFALQPDDVTRGACHKAARFVSMKMQAKAPTTPAENYHLTLLFLGNTISIEQETAARQAASLIRGEPIDLTLDMASSFTEANAWWLGSKETPVSLQTLRADLHKRVTATGIAVERSKFVPHVTFTRDHRKLPQTIIEPIRWKSDSFVLIQSEVGPYSSKYSVLERWPLTGAAESAKEQYSFW